MKKIMLTFLFLSSFLLSSCGPQVAIEGDLEESRIIIDEERQLFTIYTRVMNTSTLPSGELFLNFIVHHDELRSFLGTDTIVIDNRDHTPMSFTVSAQSGYLISETFEYDETIQFDNLEDAIEVIVYDENGEEATRYFINQIEKEQ